MLKWIRIEAGDYKSDDNRFRILKSWDRVYGKHWKIYDTRNPNYYKGLYHEKTLLDCKMRAEAILDEKP